MHVLSALILSSVGLTLAYEVPANLKAIYDAQKTGKCENKLPKGSGFDDGQSEKKDMGYCGDIDGAIYLYSTSGAYGDMDIDCDGANRLKGDCHNDGSGQSQTAFMRELQNMSELDDLDAGIHPYVVFGTAKYDPKKSGLKPLSVMAIVCGGKLHYGIWGDTNGNTATGEASLALGKLCFPDEEITGNSGHTDKDVLYIGFTGNDAVPKNDTKWEVKDTKTFEASIKSLGDELVKGLGSAGSKGSTGSWTDDSSSSFTTSARTTKKPKTRTLNSTAPPTSTTKKPKSCRQD
ncbi:Fungal chitosanase [Penicillium fimorum]|uniref:Endo-chitosanase n=1 Tax=Penicillium fimorum TaxID=1882269 RepID=A0A9X0C307_9EURO|nr:Fungal chitosanase [Penicillium fimorum]